MSTVLQQMAPLLTGNAAVYKNTSAETVRMSAGIDKLKQLGVSASVHPV